MEQHINEILSKVYNSAAKLRRRKIIVSSISVIVAAITLAVMILPAVATTGVEGGDVRMEDNLAEDAPEQHAPEESEPAAEPQDSAPAEETQSVAPQEGPQVNASAEENQEPAPAEEPQNTDPSGENDPQTSDSMQNSETPIQTPAATETPSSGENTSPDPTSEGEGEVTGEEGEGTAETGEEVLLNEEDTELTEEVPAEEEVPEEKKEKPVTAAPEAPVYISVLEGEDRDNGIQAKLSFSEDCQIEEGASLSVHFVKSGDGDPAQDETEIDDRFYLPADALVFGAREILYKYQIMIWIVLGASICGLTILNQWQKIRRWRLTAAHGRMAAIIWMFTGLLKMIDGISIILSLRPTVDGCQLLSWLQLETEGSISVM